MEKENCSQLHEAGILCHSIKSEETATVEVWQTWQEVEGRERCEQLLEGQHAVRQADHANQALPMHHDVVPPSGQKASHRVVQDRCNLGCKSQPGYLEHRGQQ